MKYTKKYLCELTKKIFIYFVLFTMLFSGNSIIAAQKTGDEMLVEISDKMTELFGDDIPNAQDDDYAAYNEAITMLIIASASDGGNIKDNATVLNNMNLIYKSAEELGMNRYIEETREKTGNADRKYNEGLRVNKQVKEITRSDIDVKADSKVQLVNEIEGMKPQGGYEKLNEEELKEVDSKLREYFENYGSYTGGTGQDDYDNRMSIIASTINDIMVERGYVKDGYVTAYTYIVGEQTVDTEDDDDDFEDTIPGKIITAIIQIVAIIGDAADQTMAYIMYGTGTWKSYNVLIKEPEVEAEGAAQIDMGAMRKKIQYPKIVYSPEEIFTGKNPVSNKKIALLDIDFINRSKRSDYTSSDGFEDRNILKQNIASWYLALRNIAIVALISILIFTGIKMMLSVNSNKKAKYKQMIVDWLVAVIILFSMHFIMSFILKTIDSVTTLFTSNESGTYSITVKGDKTKTFKTNLMGAVRFGIRSKDLKAEAVYLAIYFALIAFTLKFTIVYLKRTLKVAFLTLIAPIVAATYPIDKMGDGKAQGFEMWLKEYIFNALLQVVHLLMYKVMITSAIDIAADNPLYAILAIGFMVEAERIFRQIFGFDSRGGGNVGGLSTASAIATGAMANKAVNAFAKVGGKVSKEGKELELKDMDKPDKIKRNDYFGAFGNGKNSDSNGNGFEIGSNKNQNSGNSNSRSSVGKENTTNDGPQSGNQNSGSNSLHRNSNKTAANSNPLNPGNVNNGQDNKNSNNPFANLMKDKLIDPFANKAKNIANAPSRKAKQILKNAGIDVEGNKDWKKQLPKNATKAAKNKLARKIGWDKSRGTKANVARLTAKTLGAATRLTAKVGIGTAVTAAVLGASLADGKANPFKALGTGILAAKTGGKLMKKGEKLVGKSINGARNIGRSIKYGDKNAYQMKYLEKMRSDKRTDDYFIRTYGIDKKDDEKERWIQHFYGLDAKEYKKARAFSNELSKMDVNNEMDKFRKNVQKNKQQNWENEFGNRKNANGEKMTKHEQAQKIAEEQGISYEDAVNGMKIDEYRRKNGISNNVSNSEVQKQMNDSENRELQKAEDEYKKRVAEKVRQQTGDSSLTDDEAMQRKYMDKNDDIANKTIQGKNIIQEENSSALYLQKERENYINDKLSSAETEEEARQRRYYYDTLFENIKKYNETINH